MQLLEQVDLNNTEVNVRFVLASQGFYRHTTVYETKASRCYIGAVVIGMILRVPCGLSLGHLKQCLYHLERSFPLMSQDSSH